MVKTSFSDLRENKRNFEKLEILLTVNYYKNNTPKNLKDTQGKKTENEWSSL